MRAEAISRERLVSRVVDLALGRDAGDERLCVAVDGAPGAQGAAIAASVGEGLTAAGRPAMVLSAWDFLRPASLRLEYGREDPDVFYDEWLDVKGLYREVFGPLGDDGRILPTLWDAARDRATRAAYVEVPPHGVVVFEGALLLGRGLPFDVSVHLWLSPGALRRRTEDAMAWTVPAYERYENEVGPTETTDLAVRMDDPRHPALIIR
jgi:hypothetical protein